MTLVLRKCNIQFSTIEGLKQYWCFCFLCEHAQQWAMCDCYGWHCSVIWYRGYKHKEKERRLRINALHCRDRLFFKCLPQRVFQTYRHIDSHWKISTFTLFGIKLKGKTLQSGYINYNYKQLMTVSTNHLLMVITVSSDYRTLWLTVSLCLLLLMLINVPYRKVSPFGHIF